VICSPRYRVLASDEKTVARYNLGRNNKSLDASGISGLVFDISSVTQLLPAASTPVLGGFANLFDNSQARSAH